MRLVNLFPSNNEINLSDAIVGDVGVLQAHCPLLVLSCLDLMIGEICNIGMPAHSCESSLELEP